MIMKHQKLSTIIMTWKLQRPCTEKRSQRQNLHFMKNYQYIAEALVSSGYPVAD